jgi:hypothetical protein
MLVEALPAAVAPEKVKVPVVVEIELKEAPVVPGWFAPLL